MQTQACFTWTPKDSVINSVGSIVFSKMMNDERIFKSLSKHQGNKRNMNISPTVALSATFSVFLTLVVIQEVE